MLGICSGIPAGLRVRNSSRAVHARARNMLWTSLSAWRKRAPPLRRTDPVRGALEITKTGSFIGRFFQVIGRVGAMKPRSGSVLRLRRIFAIMHVAAEGEDRRWQH